MLNVYFSELKAAQTAMLLLRWDAVELQSGNALLAWLKPYEDFVYRKIGDGDFSDYESLSKKLISKMVLLIKEELHHFQQMWEIMESRGVTYDNSYSIPLCQRPSETRSHP